MWVDGDQLLGDPAPAIWRTTKDGLIRDYVAPVKLDLDGTLWVAILVNPTLLVIVLPRLGLRLLAGYPLLSLQGMIGSDYVVQRGSSVVATNWIDLKSITNLTANPFQFLDTTGSAEPMRFDRAVTR